MSSATYRTLLRAPGAAAFFLTAAVGRVGIAMTSLGIVWLVHARTGSYATAGLVTGGFAVAEAVAGPQLARLIDRFGQSRVLPPALLAHAAAVATLLALVAAGTSDWLMTAGGVLAGATIPQLGALSAARWAALLRDERAAALPTAFALESLANELAYLAGPALVSILGASGYPAVGTVLAAALVVAGGLCFAAQRRTAPPASGAARAAPYGPLAAAARIRGPGRREPGHRRVLRRHADLSDRVRGRARRGGHGRCCCSRYPVAPACWPAGCTGCAGGAQLRTCNWRWPRPDWRSAACRCLWSARRLNWGSASRSPGWRSPWSWSSARCWPKSAVRRAVLTQAFVWLNSASAAGSAGAAAAAGWAVGTFGAHGGFAVAAMATSVMAVLAVTGLRALRVTEGGRCGQDRGAAGTAGAVCPDGRAAAVSGAGPDVPAGGEVCAGAGPQRPG